MQHQFEVNANAQGQNCHNCGSPSHLLAACKASKCHVCLSTWPNTSALGYHHPYNCPQKFNQTQIYKDKQRQRNDQYLSSTPTYQQKPFIPREVKPTLPPFNYVPKNQQQSRGVGASVGGGRGSSYSSNKGGRGYTSRGYANNAIHESLEVDPQHTYQINHVANHQAARAKALAQADFQYGYQNGAYHVQEEDEEEEDEEAAIALTQLCKYDSK